MTRLFDAYIATRDFMELGGPVLYAIAATVLVMWIMIIERMIYFRTEHRDMVRAVLESWESRDERVSWNAHRIREKLISELKLAAEGSVPVIKTMVALCPLLGLLGTVTGMIEVFGALGATGTGSARTMAAGVSMATVPTMAGMVGALSGVFAGTMLARHADREVERLSEHLTMDH